MKEIFINLRQPKLSNKVWITRKELSKYFSKVIWITGASEFASSLMLLKDRIRTLIKRSGFQFTFLYLKEVYRLVIRFLAGHGEPVTPLGGVMVKRDHIGLPTIIPLRLRHILVEWRVNQRLVACILSCLSVFRVFPTSVKPSLGTIIEPFGGTVRSFDTSQLKLAVAELIPRVTLRIKSPKLIKLESAGPNATKSTWSSSLDSLAFLGSFSALRSMSAYLWNYGGRLYLLWLYGLILVSLPLVSILWILGVYETPKLGRLGVVYDQAGKARVIGITNWWIQMSLKPLHSALFRVLGNLEMDGTFDQQAPLHRLIERSQGRTFHSFDLSAATDRLPIDIQRDILNILKPGLGDRWSNLLDFPWSYKGNKYKYAVGQPMGAYSSWAMLAITHHVIVKLAALRVGIQGFSDYCVLGDDIVIINDSVAAEYYDLMKLLGVSINLSKSVQSKDFAEFAKVWVGPNVQITPIGPGLTLRLVRDKKYIASYVSQAWKLGFLTSFNEVLSVISQLRNSDYRSECDSTLWSSFGLNAFTSDKNHADANAIAWCFSYRVEQLHFLRYHIYNSLLQLRIDDFKEAKIRLEREKEFFYRNWFRIYTTRQWPYRLIEAWLKLVGPGFWTYALSFLRDEDKSMGLPNANPTWDVIHDLAKADALINVSSVDWTQKRAIRAQENRYKKFYAEFDRSVSEFPMEEFF